MSGSQIPLELSISLKAACELSVECWRLRRLSELTKDANTLGALRHAVRHMTEMLEKLDIQVVDLTGRAYDAGMVQEVIEMRQDVEMADSRAMVEETVAPTITWRGQVVHRGQIIVKRSGATSRESSEVGE
jgi:hypothetical protein